MNSALGPVPEGGVKRRSTLAAVLLPWVAPMAARAQAWPTRAVRIVVPFSAGGLTDNLTRALGQELARAWGQPVVVDNKPGANTILGAQAVAKSDPDGYTVLLANDSTLSSNPFLYSKLPYDAVKDFVPIVNIMETAGILLVVRPSLGVRSLPDFLALARSKPGEISYGSVGVGSVGHLDTEAFCRAAGLRMNHIPYKGGSEVLPALLGGQIDVALLTINITQSYVRAGTVVALANASPRRSPLFPDIPTFEENGLKGANSRSWFGLVAPARTPPEVVDRIAAAVSAVITDPAFRKRYIEAVGLEVVNLGPGEFRSYLAADRAETERRVTAAHIRLD